MVLQLSLQSSKPNCAVLSFWAMRKPFGCTRRSCRSESPVCTDRARSKLRSVSVGGQTMIFEPTRFKHTICPDGMRSSVTAMQGRLPSMAEVMRSTVSTSSFTQLTLRPLKSICWMLPVFAASMRCSTPSCPMGLQDSPSDSSLHSLRTFARETPPFEVMPLPPRSRCVKDLFVCNASAIMLAPSDCTKLPRKLRFVNVLLACRASARQRAPCSPMRLHAKFRVRRLVLPAKAAANCSTPSSPKKSPCRSKSTPVLPQRSWSACAARARGAVEGGQGSVWFPSRKR
mmetsp:Transcript_45521/g.90177  ORF Transcript_45521/g.90177 Transcript_45521/m.90177 type:complete len:286 (-) Transcript_45521:228-1085(-)